MARTPRSRRKSTPAALVWSQGEPDRRAVVTLSRERILKAAMALADKDGLDAVSLRNVAERLGTNAMRLYRYTATKEGLLDLMVDAIYAELCEGGPFRGDWRTVLRALAHRLRDASRRHRWFVGLLGGRLFMGPNTLAFLELILSAVQRTIPDIDDVLEAVRTLNAWAVGALHTETSELLAERESGLDQRAWQDVTWPWLKEQLATGAFPTVEQVVKKAVHPTHDEVFAQGLEAVLDGIAARFAT